MTDKEKEVQEEAHPEGRAEAKTEAEAAKEVKAELAADEETPGEDQPESAAPAETGEVPDAEPALDPAVEVGGQVGHATPPEPLERAREAMELLKEHLGESFVGFREDRGELTLWVKPRAWVSAARFLNFTGGFTVLSDLTAVDYLDREPRFDLSAILLDMESRDSLRLKTMLSEDEPRVETLSSVWSGANWFEREVYDLFGITFDGHPDLKRILLPPDYHGHPLRKDYPVTGPPNSVYR